MNKDQFLEELRKRLSGLPKDDIEERIAFYSEMIDDRMEEGVTQEEAVAGIGAIDLVVNQIMAEIPLTKLVKERVNPQKRRSTWKNVLFVLGAPVWIPLIIAVIAVLFSFYVVIWAVVLCIYAADFTFAAGAVAGLVMIFVYIKTGNPAGASFFAGAGLVCAGLAILLFFAGTGITKSVLNLTGKIFLRIKTSFVGKETRNNEPK